MIKIADIELQYMQRHYVRTASQAPNIPDSLYRRDSFGVILTWRPPGHVARRASFREWL